MKLSSLTTEIAYPTATDSSQEYFPARVFAALRRSIDSVRRANSERAMRHELAELDLAILKDIGVAEDEIYRVRARQEFTPRNWRA